MLFLFVSEEVVVNNIVELRNKNIKDHNINIYKYEYNRIRIHMDKNQ